MSYPLARLPPVYPYSLVGRLDDNFFLNYGRNFISTKFHFFLSNQSLFSSVVLLVPRRDPDFVEPVSRAAYGLVFRNKVSERVPDLLISFLNRAQSSAAQLVFYAAIVNRVADSDHRSTNDGRVDLGF